MTKQPERERGDSIHSISIHNFSSVCRHKKSLISVCLASANLFSYFSIPFVTFNPIGRESPSERCEASFGHHLKPPVCSPRKANRGNSEAKPVFGSRLALLQFQLVKRLPIVISLGAMIPFRVASIISGKGKH